VQADIGKRICKKFGVKGRNLPELLAKLHNKLPHGLEREMAYLFDAQARTKHPKRRGQVDLNRLKTIRRSCLAKLDTIDPARERSRARAMLLAEFAARMLLFVAGFVGLLYWLELI
jgi:hypothetical protein